MALGQGNPIQAAVTAWLYGDKILPAYWQECLPRENTFLFTSSAWGRSLWRQNHRSHNHMLPLHHFLESRQANTPWTLLALSIPCCSFPFYVSWWVHMAHPTDALQHKWEPKLVLLNTHGSVVSRFLSLWLLGTGKCESDTDSVSLEKF